MFSQACLVEYTLQSSSMGAGANDDETSNALRAYEEKYMKSRVVES